MNRHKPESAAPTTPRAIGACTTAPWVSATLATLATLATVAAVAAVAAVATLGSACAHKAAAPPQPVAHTAAELPATPPAPTRIIKAPSDEILAPRITPDADFRAKPPTPGPLRPFAVPAVKRFKLKNGLSVILAESHKLPLVSLEMVIKTGGAANPKGQAGLADLTANLLDEGTTTRSALQIADEISFLGASLGTSAGWDASSVSVSSLTENLDKALDVFADVLLHPVFDEKEYTRVKSNLLTALSRRKDSPPTVAAITFARAVYGESHPYAWPTAGTTATIEKLSPALLRKFYETYYHPNNAVLVAAGDITEAELRQKMEKVLSTWKSKPVPRVALPKPVVPGPTKIYLVDKAAAPQSSIKLGLVGLQRTSPDYYKAFVMNQILGGSFRRLDMNLREQKGWTYGVRSVFEARQTPGPWSTGGEFQSAHTAEAIAEILRDMRSLRDVDVSDAELQDVKDESIKAFPARFSTVNQIASQMVALAVYGLPNNDLETFTKKIAAVTKGDVRAMAQKYLTPEKLAIVVVGDQKSNETALRKLADVELRDVDGLPLTGDGAKR